LDKISIELIKANDNVCESDASVIFWRRLEIRIQLRSVFRLMDFPLAAIISN